MNPKNKQTDIYLFKYLYIFLNVFRQILYDLFFFLFNIVTVLFCVQFGSKISTIMNSLSNSTEHPESVRYGSKIEQFVTSLILLCIILNTQIFNIFISVYIMIKN